MEIIRQSQSNSCVAATLAMIVGESEQYVLDWFQYNSPPFNDQDAFIFLAHHGIFLSISIEPIDDYLDLVNNKSINMEISIHDRLFYMIVRSKTNPKLTHACFLNNGKVYDPLHDTPQELKNYDVICMYPFLQTEPRWRLQTTRS